MKAEIQWKRSRVAASAPDLVDPVVTRPAERIRTTTSEGGRLPLRLTWHGSDDRAGIDHVEVRRRVGNRPWELIRSDLHAESLDLEVNPWRRYRFAVRAIDRAGNATPWMAAEPFDAEHRHPRQPVADLVDPRLHASDVVLAERPVSIESLAAHLRSHTSCAVPGWSVCMHARGGDGRLVEVTTASMIAELRAGDGRSSRAWVLNGSPCEGRYRALDLDELSGRSWRSDELGVGEVTTAGAGIGELGVDEVGASG